MFLIVGWRASSGLLRAAAPGWGPCALRDQYARIASPTTGSLIALNPEILPNCQHVSFSVEGGKFRGLTNGKVFAQGSSAQWPWPGRPVGEALGPGGNHHFIGLLESGSR